MANRRQRNRKKRRMPCELRVDSRTHSGLVLDLSPSGLYIQTSADTRRGQLIDLGLSIGVGDPILLQVEVVRKKIVPPRLRALAGGGIGVRILAAPEAYYGFLGDIGLDPDTVDRDRPAASDEASADESDASRMPRFRIRVKQIGGPRSRNIEVAAPDPTRAGELALEELGEGWKVLDLQPL